MAIKDILLEKGSAVARVDPEASVDHVIDELSARRIGAVLVMQGDSILGLVSERDIVRALARHDPDVRGLRARDIMTSPLATIGSGDSVIRAMGLVTGRRIRHLPVVDSGILVGIVSIGDLVKARIEEIESEADALKDYIGMA